MAPEIDTPTGSTRLPLFSDTTKQWHRAINATVAVSRFRRSQTLARSARQQDLEATQHESEIQEYGSINLNGDAPLPNRQASHNEEMNQATHLDPDALHKKLEDTNPEVEVLQMIRNDLVKQLDAYGIVLVLLAGITFVAILQPPGSFNNGKLQSSISVSLFMLFATLSFFTTFTGLFAVMVGCAQLFRPFFYTKLAEYTVSLENSKRLFSACQPTENGGSDINSSGNDLPVNNLPAKQNACLRFKWCWAENLAFEDIHVLAKFCVDNIYRIRRIRIYLGLALVFCIFAYICGALAVMVKDVRQMLVGAMGVGGVILVYEIYKTMSAAMNGVPESRNRLLQREIHRYTMQQRGESRPQIHP